jgi:uncharacterized zinc-type alcohol dehydrogenase-like protein
MTTVTAYAAPSPGAPLARTTIERRPLDPRDIKVEVRYAGICHSDIHQVHGDWGKGLFPMVPGHEIAGVVTEVTRHAVGDRVGVGVIVSSCRTCDNCKNGLEQHCTGGGSAETYADIDRYRGDESAQGGYSTHIVVDEHFVLRIPEGLSLDEVAPLLCAGITTYCPHRWTWMPTCRCCGSTAPWSTSVSPTRPSR